MKAYKWILCTQIICVISYAAFLFVAFQCSGVRILHTPDSLIPLNKELTPQELINILYPYNVMLYIRGGGQTSVHGFWDYLERTNWTLYARTTEGGARVKVKFDQWQDIYNVELTYWNQKLFHFSFLGKDLNR